MKLKKILYVVLGCIGVALGGIGGSPSAPACFPVPPACSVLFCQEFGKAEPLVYRDKTVQKQSGKLHKRQGHDTENKD